MVMMGEEHTARHGLTEDVSDAVKSGASVGLSTHHIQGGDRGKVISRSQRQITFWLSHMYQSHHSFSFSLF